MMSYCSVDLPVGHFSACLLAAGLVGESAVRISLRPVLPFWEQVRRIRRRNVYRKSETKNKIIFRKTEIIALFSHFKAKHYSNFC
jgi:hypothetical protein